MAADAGGECGVLPPLILAPRRLSEKAGHMVQIIEPTDMADSPAWVVLCPVCGADYAHHRRIDVYVRDGEDGPATRTTVEGLRIETVQHATGNPSGRRGGFVVAFAGECGHTWELRFQQHKGNTFIEAARGPDVEGAAGDGSGE
jgi:hypothetical protein